MNKERELENYLSISPNKFGIYLFDKKNLKNLYKKELILNESNNSINLGILKKFLDKNVFEIEKLSGEFVENIFFVFEDNKIFNVDIGIKKKNYNFSITKKYLQNSLIEAKDLFRENYPNQEIMHMIINKYFINDKSYFSFEENLKSDHFALEIQFKSISNSFIHDLNKILENYQIKIIKYIDGNYVKNFFDKKIELAEMCHKILNGYNENEVSFVPKNPKRLGFFEKFFQLFS
mgnify:CR=1 FL=1|tara:strand:- start:2197 stop:2898 length:702 start_codon:yes stop_codon:yes gene_type:complete